MEITKHKTTCISQTCNTLKEKLFNPPSSHSYNPRRIKAKKLRAKPIICIFNAPTRPRIYNALIIQFKTRHGSYNN